MKRPHLPSTRLGRRHLIRQILGTTGLASLATGLAPGFLRAPSAFASPAARHPDQTPQFLILSASDRGDPMNVNCPGSYELDGIGHPAASGFEKTELRLGERSSHAAALWASLPQWALDRSCFVHHATRSAVHSEMGKILRLSGATPNDEMLPSLIAHERGPVLGTIQSRPVNLGRNVNVHAGGTPLPRLRPTALKQLLTASDSPLAQLRQTRDRHVDAMYAVLRRDGTKAQQRYLDARLRSRDDARKLADDAASAFALVESDDAQGELLAALALFKLGVCPVVTVSIPFGGDNHSDVDLQEEIAQHEDGIAAMARLWSVLEHDPLRDQVTLAIVNVFGRNLVSEPGGGRDHWSKHAVSLICGSSVQGGVLGGLVPAGADFTSVGIDSATGTPVVDGGDVPYGDSLAAVGKTIWAATGTRPDAIDATIPQSRLLSAALR